MDLAITGSAAMITMSAMARARQKGLSISSGPKISLAQWSLHRSFEEGKLKAEDFAAIAGETYGISAVEYVNGFYEKHAKDQKYWNRMKSRADEAGIKSLLIMVDNEGLLGDPVKTKRLTAVENHYKWIEAAKLLNCHSIRVNAFGKGSRDELRVNLVDGLSQLAAYGSELGIQVLLENHGLHTSDAEFMTSIIKETKATNLGTLPDFGNWCLNAEWGSTQGGNCTEVYDPYKGLSEMLPFAKGVSAKSYDFDTAGNETTIDYKKMFEILKTSSFDGYIGIEYEGQRLSEEEGIKATKRLIENVWKEI